MIKTCTIFFYVYNILFIRYCFIYIIFYLVRALWRSISRILTSETSTSLHNLTLKKCIKYNAMSIVWESCSNDHWSFLLYSFVTEWFLFSLCIKCDEIKSSYSSLFLYRTNYIQASDEMNEFFFFSMFGWQNWIPKIKMFSHWDIGKQITRRAYWRYWYDLQV